jgi:signal peptidase I
MNDLDPQENPEPLETVADTAAAAAAPPAGETAIEAPPQGGAGRRFWSEWVRPLLLVLVVMGSFRSALADWNDVPSGSMRPTIVEGDRIFVNKAAYSLRVPFTRLRLVEWAEPKRGDIVVLFSPEDGKRLVKRVVGLPGDRLEMLEGRLLINDQPATYAPIDPDLVSSIEPQERSGFRFFEEDLGDRQHQLMVPDWPGARGYFGRLEVPPDHYFVMGDNRNNSRDSRYFGFVERAAIVGRATYVAFSLDKTHGFPPSIRWNRFLSALH